MTEPKKPTPEVEWQEAILRAIMRSAIPVEDVMSRGALKYVHEIVDFFETFHVELKPLDDHDPDTLRIATAWLDEEDHPLRSNVDN